MAIVSNDLKRVLAYSTVSQLGYMVYAIGAGGIFESQFHLFSHAIFKALLFLGAGAVIHSVGTRDMREMGGLGKQMPLVRNVFITGAIALAGIIPLNGFWSKELVLEAGLKGGPVWAYALMVLTAGLTAYYTFRCVWMVFFGTPARERHAHDAGTAMKVALIPLALGALTTWLVAGPFKGLLEGAQASSANSTPGAMLTLTILGDVLSSPLTLLALGVIALGLVAWWQRERLNGVAQRLQIIGKAAAHSFGFEAINRGVVSAVQESGEALRVTQTGLLNWNIFGILLALAIVLAILIRGA
jgi:NADH-quinone oxidoreductase subunit L